MNPDERVECPQCRTKCKVHREAHADSINCLNCGLLCEVDFIEFAEDIFIEEEFEKIRGG